MATVAGIPDTQQSSAQRDLYYRDYYTWARQQADALRRRDFDAVDWENISEEIEALVRGEESSLRSQYSRIMEHLLKLQYCDPRETYPIAGWLGTVHNARGQADVVLHHNPGLKGRRDQLCAEAWPFARKNAINAFVHCATERMQNLSALLREQKRLTRDWNRLLPQDNPYTRQQLEAHDWFPDQVRLAQRPQGRQQPATKID